MRDELASKYDVERVEELTIEEVEEIWAMKNVIEARIDDLMDRVPFPLYPTKEMDSFRPPHWDPILDMDFGEGASFLLDPDLDAKFAPGILDVLSALVRFESKTRTDWVKDPLVYDCMPELFISFAQKSRLDTGYRLLMRCIRHTFDSRTPSMDTGSGALVVDQLGDVGLWLRSDVPASMRKKTYQSEVIATAKSLLCCKCTCQCGSHGEQRIVCVHDIGPVISESQLANIE